MQKGALALAYLALGLITLDTGNATAASVGDILDCINNDTQCEKNTLLVPIAVNSSQKAGNVAVTMRAEESHGNPDNYLGSKVVVASCEANEELIGGSCSAKSSGFDPTTTNYGMVWMCDFVANSVIGVSGATEPTLDDEKHGPPIKVYASCVTGTTGKASTDKNEKAAALDEAIKEAQATIDGLRDSME